jgi:hypothetical protein
VFFIPPFETGIWPVFFTFPGAGIVAGAAVLGFPEEVDDEGLMSCLDPAVEGSSALVGTVAFARGPAPSSVACSEVFCAGAPTRTLASLIFFRSSILLASAFSLRAFSSFKLFSRSLFFASSSLFLSRYKWIRQVTVQMKQEQGIRWYLPVLSYPFEASWSFDPHQSLLTSFDPKSNTTFRGQTFHFCHCESFEFGLTLS